MRVFNCTVQICRQERRQETRAPETTPLREESAGSSSLAVSTPEPMQGASLTAKEWQRRRQANLCLYCGGKGHFVSVCPVKGQAHP